MAVDTLYTAAEADKAARLKGIALMILAIVFFSLLDASAKYLSLTFVTMQVIFVRFFSHLACTVAAVPPRDIPLLWRTRRPLLQWLRAGSLVGATTCNFIAIKHLQLAETTSIFFAGPLLVAALAGPFLGEWIGPRRWSAVIGGFIGVLIITRPGFGDMHWAVIFSIGAVCFYAALSLLTRMMAATESILSAQFYTGVLGVLAYGPMMPFVWEWPADTLSIVLFIATGFFGFLGHSCLVAAHRYAPAPILAPFIYTQIVTMTALGYLVFGDIPGQWTLIGAAVVIASGGYLLVREREVKS